MSSPILLSEPRLTGVLLVLAFLSFAVGASLPTLGPKGVFNVFTLPVREYLSVIARNAVVWRSANIFMGAAIVVLVAGMTILTNVLEEAGERTFSRLGLVLLLLAAVLWIAFSALRAVVAVRAAEELTAAGAPTALGPIPSYYEPLAEWGSALFFVYAVIGFLALAAYGASVLQAGLLPGWAGWASIIFSIGMLVVLLIRGDTLPAFHYIPPLLIGILLLLRG